MNKLSMQANALRKTANMAANLDDFERVSVPWMRNKLAPMLREAADTIESLLDRLQTTTETCENVYPGKPIDRHMMFQCSACGHVKTNGTYSPEWWNAEHTDDECAAYDGEPIKFCPHCGRKAVDA